MTLLERARRCSDKVTEYTQLRVALDQQQKLQERKNQFADDRALLKTEADRLSLVRSREALSIDVPGPLLEQLQELVDRMPREPLYIITEFSGNKSTLFFKTIRALADKIRIEVKVWWARYKEGKTPSLNADLLQALAGIPAFEKSIRELKSEWAKLGQAGDRFPESTRALDAYDRMTGRIQALWNDLEQCNVPEPVLNFLKHAAADGASLHLLTPEVLEWLRQNKVSQQFSVRTVVQGARG